MQQRRRSVPCTPFLVARAAADKDLIIRRLCHYSRPCRRRIWHGATWTTVLVIQSCTCGEPIGGRGNSIKNCLRSAKQHKKKTSIDVLLPRLV